MDTKKELISTGEAADLLGVSRSTVKRLWDKGYIEGYKNSPDEKSHLRLVKSSVLFYKQIREGKEAINQWFVAAA